MKIKSNFVLIVVAVFLVSFQSCTDKAFWLEMLSDNYSGDCPSEGVKMPPLVSAEELNDVKDFKNVVLIDVRSEDEYLAGHIPGSINLPFSMPVCGWCISGELWMELPDVDSLENMLGNAGIENNSKIILISGVAEAPNPPYPLANATRVLATLHYVGLKKVSILDGGINKWIMDGLGLDNEQASLPEKPFIAHTDQGLFVDAEYVENSIGNKIILDTRDSVVFVGDVIEPWADKAGHISTALSLPAVLFWNVDGTYKSFDELKALVEQVIGIEKKNEEIIIYCGVGGYTSSGYFVLHDVLGYKNVKLYDGSAQEWVIDHDMEL